MIISTTVYFISLGIIFILLVISLFRIKLKRGWQFSWSILLRLMMILLLSTKLFMPYYYEIVDCKTVKKGILIFPVNAFGADLEMGGNHCYINNASDKTVLVETFFSNNLHHEMIEIPSRTEMKINHARVSQFFKTYREISYTQRENEMVFVNCKE